jgi:hypothetical protein
MHTAALACIGMLLLSVSGLLRHKRIGEGFIDDTGLGTTYPHPTTITPTSQKVFTSEENRLHKKAKTILKLFLDLLHVIGRYLNTGKSVSSYSFTDG